MAEKTPSRPGTERHHSTATSQTTLNGVKATTTESIRWRQHLVSDQQTIDRESVAEPGESEDTTGDQNASSFEEVVVEEEEEEEEEELGEEEQIAEPEPPVDEKPAKRRNAVKRAMEYDLKDMYPEVNVLIEQNRRKWNFHDPDLIRALWVESKTNALAEWKVRHAKMAKRKTPTIEVLTNNTSELRKKFRQDERERRMQSQAELRRFRYRWTEVPQFGEIKLATNITTQIRYDYNRNNPPVPYYIVTHYRKYKRPPFTTVGLAKKGCQPP